MRILGFIPARGGSKEIPKKNIAIVGRRPLIEHTLIEANKSDKIDRIFISSDSEEILGIGKKFGISDSYVRPKELSGDKSNVIDAVIDAIKWLQDHDESFDAVLLLQPTSPLRTATHINEAIEQFIESNANTLASVHQLEEHPCESICMKDGSWSWLVKPNKKHHGRQMYEQKYFFLNGAIYIAKTSFICNQRSFVKEGETKLYVMEKEFGIDIDNKRQLNLVNFLMEQNEC